MNYLDKVKEKGIKTTWLAEQFGISQPAMHMKLTGVRTMTKEEEQKLIDILNIEQQQTKITDWEQTLPSPNSQISEGAYLLLVYKSVSRKFAMDTAWILNMPAIVQILRDKGAEIVTRMIKRTNKYGRPISYGEYIATDKDKLREIYLNLISEKNA